MSSQGEGRVKKVDRFEKEKTAFHNDVRNMYLEIAKNDPLRVKVIDTEKQDVDTVREEIKRAVKEHLGF